jgi:hypothetical protein
MRRNIRILYRLFATAVTLILVVLNLRLYHASTAHYESGALGDDVVAQLRFIGRALREGAGERMQALFPEGYFFSHLLYGLSWAEVGLREQRGTRLHQQALEEARWALAGWTRRRAAPSFRRSLIRRTACSMWAGAVG